MACAGIPCWLAKPDARLGVVLIQIVTCRMECSLVRWNASRRFCLVHFSYVRFFVMLHESPWVLPNIWNKPEETAGVTLLSLSSIYFSCACICICWLILQSSKIAWLHPRVLLPWSKILLTDVIPVTSLAALAGFTDHVRGSPSKHLSKVVKTQRRRYFERMTISIA